MENVDNLGSLYMIILKNDGPSTQSFLLLLLKESKKYFSLWQPPQALLSLR